MQADGHHGKSGSSGKKSPGHATARGVGEQLAYHLSCQAQLCDDLERLADLLPDNIDRQSCLSVARSIYPVIRSSHEFEESVVFPQLQQIGQKFPAIRPTVERLHAEHWEDESFGCEVRDSLLSYVAHPDASNPEALGYMLRGFFDSLRRHIAFEREYLIPVLNGDFAYAGNPGKSANGNGSSA